MTDFNYNPPQNPQKKPEVEQKKTPTLPETNSFPTENKPLERRFLLETTIFRGELSVLGSVHPVVFWMVFWKFGG